MIFLESLFVEKPKSDQAETPSKLNTILEATDSTAETEQVKQMIFL